jgi:hypothetical protein
VRRGGEWERGGLVSLTIQNPKSKIQNPKSKIQNPKSPTLTPDPPRCYNNFVTKIYILLESGHIPWHK